VSHYLLLVAVEEAFKNLKSLPPAKAGADARDPAGLSPDRGAHRGPHLIAFLGLLPARHPCAALAMLWAPGVDAAQRAREVRRWYR